MRLFRHFSLTLLLGAALIGAFFTFDCRAAAPGERNFSDEQLAVIALKTLKILHNNHYRQLELTPKTAVAHFETYIKSLDEGKFFFTQQDIQLFKGTPEEHFTALLKGDSSKAFQIYNRFLQRHREYRKFAENLLNQKLDFTGNEEFTPDRSKLPRCKDEKELKSLWTKRVKNEVLFYRLFDRAMKESSDAEDRKALEDAKRWNAGSPESKVLKRLRDLSNANEKREKIDKLLTSINCYYSYFVGAFKKLDKKDKAIVRKLKENID